MKIRDFSIKSIAYATLPLIALTLTLSMIGAPETNNQLSAEISNYANLISEVFHSSEQDKAAFLENNFCSDGTLERLSLEAQELLTETMLVDSLGRDCAIILKSFQS